MDADHRLTGYRDWNGGEYQIEYQHADAGFVTTGPATLSARSNGVRSFTQLEVGGRLSNLTVTSNGAFVFEMGCAYDANGRLSGLRDNVFGDHLYSYDAEGHLLSVSTSQAARRESFQYDGAGNVVRRNAEQFVYDANNQLMQAGNDRLTWDSRGNLIARHGHGGIWTFATTRAISWWGR